jgi:hypothetical protein
MYILLYFFFFFKIRLKYEILEKDQIIQLESKKR